MSVQGHQIVEKTWEKWQKVTHRSTTKEKRGLQATQTEGIVQHDRLIRREESVSVTVTYQKTGVLSGDGTLEKLWQESRAAHQKLMETVKKMLERQGLSTEALEALDEKHNDAGEWPEVDEKAREELEALLGPEGPLGVEAVSQRLFSFAQALSGGDASKAEMLRDAVLHGFEEAERIMGGLPKISLETRERTMEMFDQWLKTLDEVPEAD